MPASKQLASILFAIDSEKYKAIIERAALNGYHDHKFDSIPEHPEYGECICPKMQLVEDLRKFPELESIRKQVMDGDFDDNADEEDCFEMRGWLLDDDAPDGLFKELGFAVPTTEERAQWKNKKHLN